MNIFKHLIKQKPMSPAADPVIQTTCDHIGCKVEQAGFMECAPLRDGHWTQFMLLKCTRCGKIYGFPDDNLKSAIENGTEECLEELKRAGVQIPEKETNESINPSRRENKYEDL